MELSLRLVQLVLTGIGLTVFASLASALCGFPLALAILLLRISRSRLLRFVALAYISIIRGTPALLQVLVAYYVIPYALNINLPPLAAGILALSLNTAAFIAEALRGALATVRAEQRAAARALGMNAYCEWRYVVLPQVFYRAVPPLTSEFGVMLKATSLLSVIAVPELSSVSRELSTTTHLPLLIYGLTAVVFFVLLSLVSAASRRFETKVAVYLPHGT
jgi:polar amino acid transport system permease protein